MKPNYSYCMQKVDDFMHKARLAVVREHPVGSDVEWDHGGHIQSGVVEDHLLSFGTNDPKLSVKNGRTGRVVLVPMYSIELAARATT